jgi:hypothetical protein
MPNASNPTRIAAFISAGINSNADDSVEYVQPSKSAQEKSEAVFPLIFGLLFNI